MEQKNTYFGGFFKGLKSLSIGLKTTMRELFTPKITEQYPENRKELTMFDRFRGTLVMPHNANNEHHCVACGICQMACPNDTIKVVSETITTEEGKKKKVLARYEYNLGSCMFCQLCVNACPHDAITFDQNFEHAVFDRSKLVLTLNHEGSKVEEKKKPEAVKKPEAAPKAEVSPKAEATPKAEAAPKAEAPKQPAAQADNVQSVTNNK